MQERVRGPVIAVIGGSQAGPDDTAAAYAVGRELALRGATVVCGGLGGIMEAVCRGAKSAGGQTIGILPGFIAESANPYVDIAIVTGMGYARNTIVVLSAQAVIAIAGSFGTLSEIGVARGHNIPVVGLHTWQVFSRDPLEIPYLLAYSPLEAVDLALEAAGAAPSRRVPAAAEPWSGDGRSLDGEDAAVRPD